jgi:hypothetical protein
MSLETLLHDSLATPAACSLDSLFDELLQYTDANSSTAAATRTSYPNATSSTRSSTAPSSRPSGW